ncbi:MAG TPA: glycosyltransferase family 2 protein, partial [Nitrospira sp.]|nr:glycosyltransferase family 2 protein [Nitrospira sp.]
FQLLISDNASTDQTESICRQYAARDPRVRYFRNEKNMGAGWNFRRVYSMARGKYYKQAAHDDFCRPEFFETCINALERDPGLTVAYAKVTVVNVNGEFIEDYECPMRTNEDDPVVRFSDLLLLGHRCYQVFGIHRLSALQKLPPQGSFAHADRILLAQLGLAGRFYEAPERLFISTRHEGQSVWTMPTRTNSRGFRLTRKPGSLPNLEWWDPSRRRAITFPEWNAFVQYCKSIHNSPLALPQKAGAYGVLAQWAGKFRRRLMGDVVLAADQILWNFQSSREAARQAKPAKQGMPATPEMELTAEAQGGKSV